MIFTDEVDYRRFLRILKVALTKFGAECFGYCLMGNHYHLVLHVPNANLDSVMHHVDGLYARFVNWRHRTTGRLFEAPYTAYLIDDTSYLRNALAYIFRNPVAAGLTQAPGQYQWSSYNATMSAASTKLLTLTWLPLLFEAPTLRASREQLARYVANEVTDYIDPTRAVAEGSQEFKQRVRSVIGATLYRARLPRSYRSLGRPELSDLFAATRRRDRRAAILRAHIVHGYLLAEIADYLELHPTTVSRIVNQSGSYRLIRD